MITTDALKYLPQMGLDPSCVVGCAGTKCHPPRPLRAEVHMIAPSWSFSMLSWDQISDSREGGIEILLRHTGQPLDTREYVPN
jgi:hypothetical protein